MSEYTHMFKFSIGFLWTVVVLTIIGIVAHFSHHVRWVWALSPLWGLGALLVLIFVYGEFTWAKMSWRRTNGRW